MSKTYIGYGAKTLDTAPRMGGFSKVVIKVSEKVSYQKGNNTGRTLTLDNPWGTQKMCDDIYNYIMGYQHQPFSTTGAEIDPAAELWDGVTVGNVYGGIGTMRTRFGTMITADIDSPGEQVVDHEFPYTPKPERKIEREFMDVRASLQVNAESIKAEVTARTKDYKELKASLDLQAGQISAKVSKSGGNTSFSWDMTDTKQVWKANGSEVFRLDKNGAKVTGEIRATSGTIGGFTINSGSLTADGISISPTGIKLGNSFKVDTLGNLSVGKKFKVDSNGNLSVGNNFKVSASGKLTASSGTFSGNVYANKIQTGTDADGVDRGYVTNGQLGGGCVTTSKIFDGAVNSDKTNKSINDMLSNGQTAYNNMGKIRYGGKYYGVGLKTITGYDGYFLWLFKI